MLRIQNVQVKNLIDFRDKVSSSGYALYVMKGAAIIYSSFEEIIYLDVDNIALKDPTNLFDTPAYKETGAIFWKDLWKTRMDNPIYKVLGLECVDEYQQESGQMVVNKGLPNVFKALQLAFYMQEHSKFYFQFLQGDKDTFRFAWRVLKQPYHMVRPFMGIIGNIQDEKFCGVGMVQFAPHWGKEFYGPFPKGYTEDPEIQPLFLHKNFFKDQKEIV